MVCKGPARICHSTRARTSLNAALARIVAAVSVEASSPAQPQSVCSGKLCCTTTVDNSDVCKRVIWKALCPYIWDARLGLWISLGHAYTCVITTSQAERCSDTARLSDIFYTPLATPNTLPPLGPHPQSSSHRALCQWLIVCASITMIQSTFNSSVLACHSLERTGGPSMPVREFNLIAYTHREWYIGVFQWS